MTRIANMKQGEKELYDKRFQAFLSKIVDVAKYNPRYRYLYPIMNAATFKGLETPLDIAIIHRSKRKANDNKI